MIDMNKYLGKVVRLPIGETKINVSIHEDNASYLILGNNLPQQFTPRINHHADKTIWFCKDILKHGINIFKIDTVDQLGDIFTKGFTRVTFQYLWKKFMSW